MSAFSIAFGFVVAGPLDGDICNCLLLTQIRIILQNQEFLKPDRGYRGDIFVRSTV